MKFIDEARSEVIAGNGGSGSASMRRENLVAPMVAMVAEAGLFTRLPIATLIR